MNKKNSKISALLVVVCMIVSMFGGILFADVTTGDSTITINSLTVEGSFTLLATRDQVKRALSGAHPDWSEERLESVLDLSGIEPDGNEVDVTGTVTYSAQTKELTFVGEGVMDIQGQSVTMPKSKTLPVTGVSAALTVDGESYDATYDEETGLIVCTYDFQRAATETIVELSAFTADTTYNGQPSQVIYNGDATAELQVNGETKYSFADIAVSNIDCDVVVNDGQGAVITSVVYENGVVKIAYTLESDDFTPVEEFINRLYDLVLGRTASDADRDYWTNALESGATGADVARAFFGSDEFAARELSNEEIVEALYNTMYDRESDADGAAFWVEALEATDLETVVDGFINTPEWVDVCETYGIESGARFPLDFVIRLYTCALNRDAEVEGADYWTGLLKDRTITGTQAAREFFFSDEFVGQDNSDSEFVARLYRTFMDREGDADGYNFWMEALANSDRETVFADFAGAPEFAALCAEYGIDA